MPSVTLVGATGLTGSQALSYLLASPQNFFVKAITRRAAPQPTSPPAAPGAKYENEVVHDLWTVEDVAKQGDVYVSCLGTTRAQAGGADKQVLVDRDLNISLADKAKAQGAETMILVSSTGANSKSWFAYPRMKGELEDHVVGLNFPNTVIIRPGVLLHDGNRPDQRTAESVMVTAIRGLRSIGVPTTSLGVETSTVGQAIAQLAAEPPKGVSYLYDADIERLAKEYRDGVSAKL